MGKDKLIRYAELETFANSLQYPKDMPGKWKAFFGNENPIVLELACGRAEYTVGLARRYPAKNFMGVDRKGARIWRGAKTCMEERITNAAFLRTHIEILDTYFASGEVSEIWITFPDPFLQKGSSLSYIKRRLTAPGFIEMYRRILKPGGIVHLKTDSPVLYDYTMEIANDMKLEVLLANDHIYSMENMPEDLDIKTTYENRWLKEGIPIKYIRLKI